MLKALFGSKNIEKILLFLFVNRKCYGTQLHRLLKTALTPLQKGLARLESGGIITSDYEGKTRIFRFDPSYPLFDELEQLLRKSYTLLAPQERKLFWLQSPHFTNILKPEEYRAVLNACWKRLEATQRIRFTAQSLCRGKKGWQRRGKGEILCSQEEESMLIFSERGTWYDDVDEEVSYSNTFRWTFDKANALISLEHLRRGWEHPTFLFHLAPCGKSSLHSVDSHLCDGDSYFGRIVFDSHTLRLHWRIIGPTKNEEMDYFYS